MFPILLDYQPLFTEFELFVEAIDNKHELALSGHQQFPVIFVSFPCCVFLLIDPLFYVSFYTLNLFSSRECMHYFFAREAFVLLDTV
jgi:hypothetical protein